MFPADLARRRLAAAVAALLLVGMLPASVLAAAPVADDDQVTVLMNSGPTVVDVLDGDTGGPPLTIDSADAATHGDVNLVDDQTVTYEPDVDYHGPDAFTYTITDGVDTSTATVTVKVDSPPVAVDDPRSACQSSGPPLNGGFPVPEDYISPPPPPLGYFVWFGTCALLTNDTDADGDPLTWEIVTQPAHGEVLKIDEEFFAYKPNADYSAADHGLPATDFETFTYRAFDGFAYSAPATMKIWVAPINDAPSFTRGADVTVGEDSGPYSAAWATNISPGPASESWQVVHFEADTPPNGVPNLFTVPPAIDVNGNLTFTPAPDEVGLVFVTVRAKDDGGLEDWNLSGQTQPDDTSDDVTFQLVVMPDAVTAVDDSKTFSEDPIPNPVTIDVLANDTVPSGATITGVTQGTRGVVSIAPGGLSVRYLANANANGADSFTYTLSDGAGSVDTASVDVLISAVNDVPTVVGDSLNVARNASATAVNVLANDHDNDTGDTLTISAKTNGTKGTVVITGGGTGLTYQPASNATGADSFTYTVTDGHSAGVVGTVSVVIADGALPIAVTDSATMLEDAVATAIAVLGNDTDGDLDPLTITAKTNGAKGVVTLTSSTTLTYKPNLNANGSDSFTYTIFDGHGGSATGTVNVTITPVNDKPNALNDTSLSVPESAGARSLAVLLNDLEYDGDTLLITGKTNGAHGTVAITGGGTGLTYDPNQLYYGTDVFTYTVNDGHGQSDTATVLLTVVKDTVKPVATAPVQTFYNQTSGSSSVKVHLAWGGNDTGGTGVASYKLQVSVNGGSYSTISLSSASATSINRTLTVNKTYRFRVRATDKQGNVGYYAYGPTFKVVRYQNTSSVVHYSGSWPTSTNASALGGNHRYTSTAGASVSYTGSVRNIAWMTTKTTTSGSAQVWIDGTLAATINLRATSTGYKKLVYHRDFGSLGTHTIEIRSLGGGRVYFDAFALLR